MKYISAQIAEYTAAMEAAPSPADLFEDRPEILDFVIWSDRHKAAVERGLKAAETRKRNKALRGAGIAPDRRTPLERKNHARLAELEEQAAAGVEVGEQIDNIKASLKRSRLAKLKQGRRRQRERDGKAPRTVSSAQAKPRNLR